MWVVKEGGPHPPPSPLLSSPPLPPVPFRLPSPPSPLLIPSPPSAVSSPPLYSLSFSPSPYFHPTPLPLAQTLICRSSSSSSLLLFVDCYTDIDIDIPEVSTGIPSVLIHPRNMRPRESQRKQWLALVLMLALVLALVLMLELMRWLMLVLSLTLVLMLMLVVVRRVKGCWCHPPLILSQILFLTLSLFEILFL